MSMQIYKVGGCVRDRLLREQGVNAPTGDIDWVVTGATPEAMLARGFMPVGADFPVFLHPHTHEEYAFVTAITSLIAQSGTPAPTGP